jgi:hypothetical protein
MFPKQFILERLMPLFSALRNQRVAGSLVPGFLEQNDVRTFPVNLNSRPILVPSFAVRGHCKAVASIQILSLRQRSSFRDVRTKRSPLLDEKKEREQA